MDPINIQRLSSILSPPVSSAARTETQEDSSFDSILKDEIGRENDTQGVKFSKHAQARLESRNIALQPEDLQKLGNAVQLANEKGVKDSLVLMNNLAFIVSIPAKTVVTALPVQEAGSSVFTNIDGAVVV